MITSPDTFRAAHLDFILDDYYSEASPAENLTDLLVDALHWCVLNELRFDELLMAARMHTNAAVEPASTPPMASEIDAHTSDTSASSPRIPGRLSPIGEKLFALAQQFEEFANEQTERLDFDDYANVSSWETKLLAFGNLIETADRETFLDEEISEAKDFLAWIRERVREPCD